MAVWSIVQRSKMSDTFRLDAEFYRPEYLHFQKLTEPGTPLSSIVHRIMHPIEITRVYTEAGIRILLAQNIRPNYLDLSNEAYMPTTTAQLIGRNRLAIGDVLMTRSGANFGDTACYLGDPAVIFACADCLIIRPRGIPSGYLATFLNTAIGRGLLTRGAYGMAQPHIAPTYLKTLHIPRAGSIETRVHQMVEIATAKRRASQALYAAAEKILNDALGLLHLDLTPRLFCEDNYSHAAKIDRLDAEFFQPKYERLLKCMNATGRAVRLGDQLTERAKRGLQPAYSDNGEYLVINSQHVGSRFVDLATNRRTTKSQAVRNKGKSVARLYDVLLNSTGYQTIGRAQTLLEDVKAVVDSHVTILRPKPPLDPVYLGVFLNALPGFMQTERHWTGSSGQIELRLESIEDFTVWLAPDSVQEAIRRKVDDSSVARQESRRLLDDAKHTVEIAIEESESAALKYLKQL